MLIVNRPQTDPYFNIAAEEYLLKQMEEDCFMLWQNQPAIIIGKHQNTFAEINYSFVKENNIPVVRRISGGGTVFHDLGNLNFTFISKGDKEKLIDFKKFTKPIIEVLNHMGVPARFEGKNDLRVNGLKISGNAEHVYKNKVLHHGTLLFSSDLTYLNQAIKVVPERFKDKAVQSVRSKVANIQEFIKEDLYLDEFKDRIVQYIRNSNNISADYSLTAENMKGITNLVKEKYHTWQWNFGYSPKYVFETKLPLYDKTIPIKIFVNNGCIDNIESEESNAVSIDFLKEIVIGAEHAEDTLRPLFVKHNNSLIGNGIKPEKLIDMMF